MELQREKPAAAGLSSFGGGLTGEIRGRNYENAMNQLYWYEVGPRGLL